MSTIQKISLTHFRNYNATTFDLDAPIVSITGLNGVGKTNILDAIYYLCYTKSYFTGQQQQLVRHGCEGFRLEGIFNKEAIQETISCKWQGGKKEVCQNGVVCESVKDYIGKNTAVIIAPDDIQLINEGSELRRKWVDGILGQCDKKYLESIIYYQQVLTQRNAWLKMNAQKAQHDFTPIDFYDSLLAEHGAYIHEQRRKFISAFKPLLNKYYSLLADSKEQIDLQYRSDVFLKPMSDLLKDSLHNDLKISRTLKGIHKDDFDFLMNERMIRQFGSQGQKKSYLLALKIAQCVYIQSVLGYLPILLLDDIFEKLDAKRLQSLWISVARVGFMQVIVTDTEHGRLESILQTNIHFKNIFL